VYPAPGVSEYVDRGKARATVQFLSNRLNVPQVWVAEYLRVRTPRALAERLERSDAVIADFPFLARALGKTKMPKVLNTHNIEHHLLPASGPRATVRAQVKRLEEEAARLADTVCCCTKTDADFFIAAGAASVLLVPNGIDATRFDKARPLRSATREQLQIAPDETLLLFPASKFGPNREGFEWLLDISTRHGAELLKRKVRFLVVGGVVNAPMKTAVLTATGRVDEVEPYFVAADFALNPVFSGAGTNVKMADFIAARVPILTTEFGARGFALKDPEDAIFFTADSFLQQLDAALATRPAHRTAMAGSAYEANAGAIDMNRCVLPLVEWLNARI
jgi:glycosyltransferase involved in cell wall biosynthesis